MAVKVNHLSTYEAKCVSRLKALAESKGIIVHETRWGTLGMNRSCCVLIEPGVPSEKVRELSHAAQKCFRSASVRMGHGAAMPCAQGRIFCPTIYIIFHGRNHD